MRICVLYSQPYLTPWQRTVVDELFRSASFTPDHELFLNVTKAAPFFVTASKKPTPHALSQRQKILPQLTNFDLCVTFGLPAFWLLTDKTTLEHYRNCHNESPFVPNLLVLPTYDVEIFAEKAWNERPVVFAALQKAKTKPTFHQSTIWIPEKIPHDLQIFEDTKIREVIAFDVETNTNRRITEFSVAANPYDTLYIQLENEHNESVFSFEEELDIFIWLWKLCQRQDLVWVMHNSVYDLSYLTEWGFKPRGKIIDTMLWHHGMQPEMEKSLGFLAQTYLPVRPWKHLRTQPKYLFDKQEAL